MRKLTSAEKERIERLTAPDYQYHGNDGTGPYTMAMIDEARRMADAARAQSAGKAEAFDWSDWLGPARRKVLGISEHPAYEALKAAEDPVLDDSDEFTPRIAPDRTTTARMRNITMTKSQADDIKPGDWVLVRGLEACGPCEVEMVDGDIVAFTGSGFFRRHELVLTSPPVATTEPTCALPP